MSYTDDLNNYSGVTPPQQKAMDDFAASLFGILQMTLLLGPTIGAYFAGKNWFKLTGDAVAAAERGAQALVRFSILQTCLLLSMGWNGWMWYRVDSGFGEPGGYLARVPTAWTTMQWVVVPITFVLWGVAYCRAAEFALLRRGPIQFILTPVVRVLDQVHTWAIFLVAMALPTLGATLLFTTF